MHINSMKHPPLTTLIILIMGLSLFLINASAQTLPNWLQSGIDQCQQNDIVACVDVASGYLTGFYAKSKDMKMKIDPEKGQFYVQRILQIGHTGCDMEHHLDHCYRLGRIYFEGLVVPRDITKGIRYLKQACEKGYRTACSWLDNSGIPD